MTDKKIYDTADVQLDRYEMWLLRTLLLAEIPKIEAVVAAGEPTPALQGYAVHKLKRLNFLGEYLLTCLEDMALKGDDNGMA